MMGRRRIVLGLTLVLGLVVSGCARSDTTDDTAGGTETDTETPTETSAPTETEGTETATEDDMAGGDMGAFTVGLLNPTTGIFAALGADTNEGFEMYVEEQGGQLAGWDIETVLEDDEGDPTAGASKARKLIDQDGVDILIGGVSSAVAYGISDFVSESGVPYIITIAGADGLTQRQQQDNIFRISYTGSQPMHPLGEYACNELGHQTASIVSLDFAFGWETAGGFARTYEESGCEVIQEIYVPLGTEDYAPFVQQINREADVVMHVNSGPAGNLFWQTYRDFGYEVPVIGHGAITDEFLLVGEEDWQVGAQTIFYWSRALETSQNQDFVAAWEERTGQLVSQGAEAGYAVAQVLEAALEQAGEDATDPQAMIDALGEVQVTVPRGDLSFDEYNQAVMDFYIREVQSVDEDPYGNEQVTKSNVVVDTIEDVSQFWTYDPQEYLEFEPYEDLKGTWAN